ncbi:MAG: hypothetical protein ABI180_03410 [Microcoleus sp.]
MMGFTPVDESSKNRRCDQLLIDGFAAIQFFYLFYPDTRVEAAYQEVENTTRSSMMRLYSSVLISSLLLSGTAVNAQSLETRSTFFAQDNSAPKIITAVADTQSFYDKDQDNTPPRRGEGR